MLTSRALAVVLLLGTGCFVAQAARQLEQACGVQLKNWDQCGGRSACPDGVTCTVTPWKGHCCPQGSKCVKNDEYYSNCQPPAGQGDNSRSVGAAPAPVEYKVDPPVKARKTANGDWDYSQVLGLSLRFYLAQRSGPLPKNFPIKWRASSGLTDKAPDGRSVVGGYYDAGDNVKFNHPMAWTLGALAWSVVEFKAGYVKAGQYKQVLDTIKWGTDYLLRCVGDGDNIVVQVGNGAADHATWIRPEDVVGPVPVYVITPDKPGSDVAGSMAGALAAASEVFRTVNPAYSAQLLQGAVKAYNFANKYKGFYSTSVPDAGAFYKSNNYQDDLAWAAAWLAVRTGNAQYKTAALNHYIKHWDDEDGAGVWNNYDWDSNSWGAVVLLTRLFPNNAFLKGRIEAFINDWTHSTKWVKYSPKGLGVSSSWGSLRHVGNNMFLLQAYSARAGSPALKQRIDCIARQQLGYILGDAGRSFVVGYGTNPPTQPHHRAASCPPLGQECGWNAFNNPGPNPNVLFGALVGGPDATDAYNDQRNNYVNNEVAVDYNGGFTGALAAMVAENRASKSCPRFPLPGGPAAPTNWGHP